MVIAFAAFVVGICLQAGNKFGNYNASVYTQNYNPKELWACVDVHHSPYTDQRAWECTEAWVVKLTETDNSGSWTCPGSVVPTQTSLRMTQDFPCHDLISNCNTNSTFVERALTTRPTFSGSDEVQRERDSLYLGEGEGDSEGESIYHAIGGCPGHNASPSDVGLLLQFCRRLELGIDIIVTAQSFVMSMAEFKGHIGAALNARLLQIQDSILTGTMHSDDSDDPTLTKSNLLLGTLREVLYHAYTNEFLRSPDMHVPALDDLEWFLPLVVRKEERVFELMHAGGESMQAFASRVPARIRDACHKYNYFKDLRCNRQLRMNYYTYLLDVKGALESGVTEVYNMCSRTKRKSVWHRITDWAAVLGGLISLVFVTILPNTWNWVILPCGRWFGLWKDCPGVIKQHRQLRRSQTIL